ncbi:unnamed protein product [Rotaria socialis]|uniref:Ubiquitin carboxyl-terminal hydrolase n=1 Tax=Rotaria socialis TaxID=392032 RepID=A0A818D3L9_9BILA|nr:unnamed protein product [Rotaria socialis]CAF3487067.1 unnamed protein product [Rotaria socialis]CAF3576843.1 unnamed protein product [Rotaria socialis]CAF4106342.1 unnamed protein product [Rotaria socialis]CAF4207561.1 unnamed protein product [Rotaria socialis]
MSYNRELSDRFIDDQNKPYESRIRSNSYDQAMFDKESIVKNPSTIRRINDNLYLIKWIEFNHQRTPILLQNLNGPCPLIAIANILLLRNRIHLNSNAGEISTERLIAIIAEYMLQIDTTKFSAEDHVIYEHNVEDALAVLPKLQTGIDVNVKFNGVDKFEYTRECIIFDLLGIQLFHGWIIDPQNYELQKIINSNGSSYNQLVEKMLRQKQSTNEKLARESFLIEEFLEESRSQLTYYGLLKLNETMRNNQLAVLFRNNHFSTIWKNNTQLLLLVSDQGFLNQSSIVFETLSNIDNNSSFTDGYGEKWQKPVPVNEAQDRDLAIAMQNQEHIRYQEAQLRQQQQQQQRQPNREHYYEDGSKKRKKKHSQYTNDEDDGNCGCALL